MRLRRRALPSGWYPDDADSLRRLVNSWLDSAPASLIPAEGAVGALSPHAGWAFSGRLAAYSVAALAKMAAASNTIPTLAIFGGHLPSGSQPLAASESGFETPLGTLQADQELLAAFDACLQSEAYAPSFPRGLLVDNEIDNTVEVLLPLVAALMPQVPVLWLRTPNDLRALGFAKALAEAAQKLGREVLALGSSDLTHYGPSYHFQPKGQGPQAAAWVQDVNDHRFIEAMLAQDPSQVVARGEKERSACSAGAAAAALAFSLAGGSRQARLLGYGTSLEVHSADSFVGYASIILV